MFRKLALTLLAFAGLQMMVVAQSETGGLAIPPGTGMAKYRFIHAAPGLVNVDVRLDRKTVFYGMAYTRASQYKSVPAGSYLLDVTTVHGATTIIPTEPVSFSGGIDYTILVTGSVSGEPVIEPLILEIPSYKVPYAEAHVMFINTSPDAPPLDFVLDGSVEAAGVPYQGFEPPFAVGRGWHFAEVRAAGVTILGPYRCALPTGRKNTFVVFGTWDATDALPMSLGLFGSQ